MSAKSVKNTPQFKLDALIAGHNQVCQATCPHYHSPFTSAGAANAALITSADSSSLGTSKTLAKELADDLVIHGADTTKHSAADVIAIAAYASTPAEPADLTEVQNILNEVKTDLRAHLVNATPHRFADGVSPLVALLDATAAATNQGTADTLANVLKKVLNAHDRAGAQSLVVVAS